MGGEEKESEGRGEAADSQPLIAFADFTDYELIITKADNWREIFKPFFGRPERVREALQRLYPIRVCTMHARFITHDEQLFLYVEARRLIRAIEPTGTKQQSQYGRGEGSGATAD